MPQNKAFVELIDRAIDIVNKGRFGGVITTQDIDLLQICANTAEQELKRQEGAKVCEGLADNYGYEGYVVRDESYHDKLYEILDGLWGKCVRITVEKLED